MESSPRHEHRFVVAAADGGTRLDLFLAQRLSVGRRAAARLATTARINGRRAAKGATLTPGDEVRVRDDVDTPFGDHPEPVLHAAEGDVLVLVKPPGLPTVSLRGRPGPSVATWLARTHPECRSIGRPGEAGLVHRLDTGTSGLLLAARTDAAYADLRAQFSRHRVAKTYLALVAGVVHGPLAISGAIGQHRKSRSRVRVVDPERAGRYTVSPAHTRVEPVEVLGAFTLVEAHTHTGARHQVRVHLAHAGHPLVADHLYGASDVRDVTRYHLHASELQWLDPRDGRARVARCGRPSDWEPAMQSLRRASAAATDLHP